ncbi:hypothetical protein EDC39_11919 [Geothermobacter ehrlichii]|uniref:Uncharacterized protein n=1 Tax=Geothermobacter ehrlichii TaxID=213224 RepID=A0A5D3WHU8_9BACT|nr:hypothetical protein [Geothermobacter ehrlichii]TYO95442.1 hypothetical protein EDC39_11919 [Geothermobacter ehrlichii]
MNGNEILQSISASRTENSRFIRWWRKENDFVDYELLTDFLHRLQAGEEFAGFELLDTEQMWELLQKIAGDRVRRELRTKGDYLVWTGGKGTERETLELVFSDESIMHVFNEETRDMTLH